MFRKCCLLLFVALLLGVSSMKGVPAHPLPVKVQQPDGTYVTLRLVGDEWCHFQTTLDGYSIIKDTRGYYVYAQKQGGQLQPTAQVAHDVSLLLNMLPRLVITFLPRSKHLLISWL